MDRFLQGRCALVTGGASGMGRAMAHAFASAGANVIIGSLLKKGRGGVVNGELVHTPDESEMERTREELQAYGVKALAMPLDVCDAESVQSFVESALSAFDKVDILANAAGITAEQTLVGHSDALWMKVVDVNLHGTYRMVRRCLPHMIDQGWGRIINIASTAASVGAATSAAYCASKAGVVGLTRCAALEGAPHGVTCNSISPGWTQTNFGNEWMSHIAETQLNQKGADYINDAAEANPQGRLIQPKEIGALALYLCREEAFGVTMQDLTISGGSLW